MLHSLRIGAGEEPILVVHGFLGSGRNASSLAQKWSERDPSLSFLLPDLTGHGRSPPLSPDADLFSLASDLVAAARAEGASGPLRIVGHSLGGRVALAAFLSHPEDVKEVVLLDIAPGPVRPGFGTEEVLRLLLAAPAQVASREEMRRHFQAGGLSPSLTEWLLTNLVRDGSVLSWRFDREALAKLHERVSQGDLWGAVEKQGCVVSCIRGGASPFVSDEDVRRLRAAGCKVATIGEADHYLHVSRTDELVDLLTGKGSWNPWSS